MNRPSIVRTTARWRAPLTFSVCALLAFGAGCSSNPETAPPQQGHAAASRYPVVMDREQHVAGLSNKGAVAQPAMESYTLGDPGLHPLQAMHPRIAPTERERYADIVEQPVYLTTEQPVSTFSIDVDTAAYSNVRRMLNDGVLPPSDAVRIEELINYFGYDYEGPRDAATPFSINLEMATAPWNAERHLLQIGLQGYTVDAAERPAANLVFLVDVSGSMQSPDKLPLLRQAFSLLTRQLDARDSIALVVYAGSSGIVLEPTPGDQRARILSAVNNLQAGGSTHGAAGIRLAYEVAQQNFLPDGINRVVLATDGDFNVGVTDVDVLLDLVEDRRRSGVSLTTLGFGTGNYNDELMEQLADHGNGNYAYIDNLREARKVLVEELGSTLQTIAKDVKVQVEFNPAVVSEYRLIGYANRVLAREDFNNDKVDAGEIGAGHTVTALYEVTLTDSKAPQIDPLRYGERERGRRTDLNSEVAFVRLRYKEPLGQQSKLIERPVLRRSIVMVDAASSELRFAAAVAAFGEQLRGGERLEDFGYADIRKLARAARGADPHGYRSEFLGLIDLADSLTTTGPESLARRH